MKIDEPMDHFNEETDFDDRVIPENRFVEFIRDIAPEKAVDKSNVDGKQLGF